MGWEISWLLTRGNSKSYTWGKLIPGTRPRSWLCRRVPQAPGGQADHEPVMCPSWQKEPTVFWAVLGIMFPSGWKRCCFFYSTGLRLHLECCVEFWAAQYNQGLKRISPVRDRESDERTGALPIWGKAETAMTKWKILEEEGVRFSSVLSIDRIRGGGYKLKNMRFHLI